jgi:alpha-amylase/alpha-mannosidase (GH57 family)
LTRYICIHGHFYQPPRENAWLDIVETQDSAAPFHDWNERITAECYATNGAARILDDRSQIARIVKNYAQISFNIGPTLLSWMERSAPDVYATILAADLESRARFGGHGSAMAQAYHHAILPLCTARDKATEIRWGMADFRRRFGRDAEGMWLPEAAVDLETLGLLAAEGLQFVVLAPYQAERVRPIGEEAWRDARGGHIDTTRAYRQMLPSGRSIAVFFYDGMISRAVAFEGLLNRGEDLAGRLLGGFGDAETPQLVHIATDGETYGHHHRFGEMALAYALQYLESNSLARLTNYAEFLALHPPRDEVQIAERTSWSCFHGVERWRSDCGCNTGGQHGWSQSWRAPLRAALEWLRDEVGARYERAAAEIFRDPWAARDGYIEVVLDRSDASVAAFLARHGRPGVALDRGAALSLLELQRHALMMFTSCGWFFSEISGIETTQVLQYAARVVQLARQLFEVDLEPELLGRLAQAPSNIASEGDGAQIYVRRVRPTVVSLADVAAHHAITSLFAESAGLGELSCYRVVQRDHRLLSAGRMRLAIGAVEVTALRTGEVAELGYGALHLGAQTILCGVSADARSGRVLALGRDLAEAFHRADVADVIRRMTEGLGPLVYSLRSLFRDQQRAILGAIMADTLAEVGEAYHALYTQHVSLMRFLADLGAPLPGEFQVAASFTLNAALRRLVAGDELPLDRIQALIEEAKQAGAELDGASAALALRRTLDQAAVGFGALPADLTSLGRFAEVAAAVRALPFEVDLWTAQNVYHTVRGADAVAMRARASQGDLHARAWLDQFLALGELLRFRADP